MIKYPELNKDEFTFSSLTLVSALVPYLKVRVQVGQKDRDQSVHLVKDQLQHRQLSVEQLAHIKLVDDVSQDSKANGFILENQVQKSRDEVHALAVV